MLRHSSRILRRNLHGIITKSSSKIIMATKETVSKALRVVVFLGTVRENNFGSRAAKFMVKKFRERGHSVTLLGR